MKFTVDSIEFQKAIVKISGVVPAKSTLPILENILFTLSDNNLSMVATDMELSMSVNVEVRGSEDGSITVPAKRLIDTLRALPATQLVFYADANSNKIKMLTDNGEYNLIGESSDQYPAIPDFSSANKIECDGVMLRSMIAKTSFAVGTDELRLAMTGMLLQIRNNQLVSVATDGHRLVRIIYSNVASPKGETEIIVPSKALGLLSKTIEEGKVNISYDDTHVKFECNNFTLISQLIKELYPKYESVIPLENDKDMVIDRNELLASLKRISLYANGSSHQVRFSMQNNELKLTAEDIDFGVEAREKLVCEYSKQELEIGFNAHYISDILSHIDSDKIVFCFGTPVKAATVKPFTAKENEDVLMVVMPVRINV